MAEFYRTIRKDAAFETLWDRPRGIKIPIIFVDCVSPE